MLRDDVQAALAASSLRDGATILRVEAGAMGGARVDVGIGRMIVSFVVERSSFLSIGVAPTAAPALRVPLIFVLADESVRDPSRGLRTVDEAVRAIAAEMPALDERFRTPKYLLTYWGARRRWTAFNRKKFLR